MIFIDSSMKFMYLSFLIILISFMGKLNKVLNSYFDKPLFSMINSLLFWISSNKVSGACNSKGQLINNFLVKLSLTKPEKIIFVSTISIIIHDFLLYLS